MIASCYRRMNLFQEALKVYEDIHQEYPDNLDCLRGLVQIRKELGMKYQHFGEKLMILERDEEAKRMMMGAANQNPYGNNDYYDDGGYGGMRPPPMEQPDMSMFNQQKERNTAAGKKPRNDDDDDWGNVNDIL